MVIDLTVLTHAMTGDAVATLVCWIVLKREGQHWAALCERLAADNKRLREEQENAADWWKNN